MQEKEKLQALFLRDDLLERWGPAELEKEQISTETIVTVNMDWNTGSNNWFNQMWFLTYSAKT